MRWLVRGVALLMAFSALVWPGWGLIDLAETWNADANAVLAGGWALFFSILVAVPFLVVTAWPNRAAPAIWTLWIASASLLVGAMWAQESELLVLLLWLVVGTAAVALPPVIQQWHPIRLRPRVIELALIVVTGAPWLVYAGRMAGYNRQMRPDTDFSVNVDHYSVQTALGLAVLSLAILAGCWPAGRRQIGTSVGVVAAYFGVLSYAWAGYPAAVSRAWAAAVICWGLCIAGWAWWSSRNTRARRPAP